MRTRFGLSILVCVSALCVGRSSAQPAPAELLRQGLELADKIQDANSKARALSELISAYASHDPKRALELAREMEDAGARDAAVVSVAGALAASDVDGALEVADGLAERFYQPFRSQALAAVAAEVAKKDLDRAEQIVATIESAVARDLALAGVALAAAEREPKRAPRVASRISSPEGAARTLARLVPLLGRADVGAAQTAIVLAARKLDEAPELTRWQVMSELVQASVHVDLERAARYAEAVGEPEAQAHALAAVGAVLWAQEGRDSRQRSSALFDRAVRLAGGLPPLRRASAMARLSAAASAFDQQLAANLAHQAQRAAAATEEEDRDAAFFSVATHLGPVDLSSALAAAEQIQDPSLASRGYRVIAEAIAKVSTQDARKALQTALERARSIPDTKLRDSAIAQLCRAWAGISPQDALAAVGAAASLEGQVACLAAILQRGP